MAPKCFETFFNSSRAIPAFTFCGTDVAPCLFRYAITSGFGVEANALKYTALGQSMMPAELIAIPCETEPGLDIGAAHQRLCLVSRRTYTLTRWEVDLFYRDHELISLVKCLIDDLGAWSRTARTHARSRGCLGPDRDANGSGGYFSSS